MNKGICITVFLMVLGTACASATPVETPTPASTPAPSPTSSPQPSPTETQTATPVATLDYPQQGYGPTNFPAGVDPLTGLPVSDPALLDRRPLAIQISNLPRDVRPQWGLSLADIVFDYYTEAGGTRFTAIFYGQDASMVGPIRSARFVNVDITQGYQAVFAFGGAYIDELQALEKSTFANRLVLEGSGSPLFRYDPNGVNALVVNTADLSGYMAKQGVPNGRQNLDGMFFQLQPPDGGSSVRRIYLRYAAQTYDRFDYDPASGRYLRLEDVVDDPSNGSGEHYAQLTDKLTGQPVAFDNLVVLFVPNTFYRNSAPGKNEIIDIKLTGIGPAYVFRDGKAYNLQWKRDPNGVVTLLSGASPFPLKPGTTSFEIVGMNSKLQATNSGWRFTHHMP